MRILSIKEIAAVFLVVCLAYSCSQKTYTAIEWQGNSVMVDGAISEWSNPLKFYDTKSRINYTLANDRHNLYLCCKLTEEAAHYKLLRSGLTLHIDPAGKTTYPVSFTYPLPSQAMMDHEKRNNRENESNQGDHHGKSYMVQKLLSEAKEIQLTGFKPPLEGKFSLAQAPGGIYAAINFDSFGIMYYEAVIPLATFYKKELMQADTLNLFSFQIELKGVPEPPARKNGEGDESPGMGGGGHRGGGGMRGGGGGMRGGGQRGGFSDMNNPLFMTDRIEVKKRLAWK